MCRQGAELFRTLGPVRRNIIIVLITLITLLTSFSLFQYALELL